MFLLRPTAQTREIFAYCVAAAAERTGVLLHAICVMSNHYHAVVTDPDARLPDFLHYVNEYVAKCINASLGRWENLWATEPPSAVRLDSAEDVLDKMVYVLTNPVKPFLVKKHCRWPGLLGFRRSDSAEVVRPKVFFRPTGSAPQRAKLVFVPPPAWAHLAPKDFEHQVEQEVATAEAG